jgi:hypothetical protein
MTTYKQENSDENTAEGEWFHLAQLMPDTVRYHGISHDTLQYCGIVTESDDEEYLGTPEQWKLMLGSFNFLSYGKKIATSLQLVGLFDLRRREPIRPAGFRMLSRFR